LTFRPGNVDRPIHVVLGSMGFSPGEPFSGTGLPAGWQFLVMDDATTGAAPLNPMDPPALANFLAFTGLTANGNLLVPATLTVNQSDFRTLWRNGAGWPGRRLFDFVDFHEATSTFAWSVGGATGNDVCRHNFVLAQREDPGAAALGLPPLRYAVELVPHPDSATEWSGSRLTLGATNLGDLAFGTAVDVSTSLKLIVTGDGRLHLRASIAADQSLALLPPDTVEVVLPADLFRFGLTAAVGGPRATRVLLSDSPSVPLSCRMTFRSHLLMAATAPLPIVLPTALSGPDSSEPVVQLELTALLDANWDRDRHEVLALSGTGAGVRVWEFADVFLRGGGSAPRAPEFAVSFPRPLTAGLPSLRFSLEALLGQGGSDKDARVELDITPGLGSGRFRTSIDAQKALLLPMLVRLTILPPGAAAAEVLEIVIVVRIVMKAANPAQSFRLQSNRIFYRLMGPPAGDAQAVLDLRAFAVVIPTPILDWDDSADPAGAYWAEELCHGWLDVAGREFVLKTPQRAADSPLPNPALIFPGNIRDAGGGLTDLGNRLRLEFEPVDPAAWPEDGPNKLFLRINGSGLSLHAKVQPNISATLLPQTDDNFGLIALKPHAERRGVASEFVVIDNLLRAALLFGEVHVPACKDLIAAVELGMRQDRPGQVPRVFAKVSPEWGGRSARSELHAGFLDLQLDEHGLEFDLAWDAGGRNWDVAVLASGSLSFGGRSSSTSSRGCSASPCATCRFPGVRKTRAHPATRTGDRTCCR
jgi:hypothetical protein